MTGNLGGEQYVDHARGPLNEGGMFAERQGYHLPQPPSGNWQRSSPFDGVQIAGVVLYSASFDLDIRAGYDVPLSFAFEETSANSEDIRASNFRCQLYVNGYQFGKYVHNIGPQTHLPVPEGILDHRGSNTIALTLWAQDAEGAALRSLRLVSRAVVQSGYRTPGLAPQPRWSERVGAY